MTTRERFEAWWDDPLNAETSQKRVAWTAWQAAELAERAAKWEPIETAPKDILLLLWWRPIGDNKFAQAPVLGQVSSFEPGKWWNGQRGEYQDIWHVTHWMPAPTSPGASSQE